MKFGFIHMTIKVVVCFQFYFSLVIGPQSTVPKVILDVA